MEYKEGDRVEVAAVWYSEKRECCVVEKTMATVETREWSGPDEPYVEKQYLRFDGNIKDYGGSFIALLGLQPGWFALGFEDEVAICIATDENIRAAQEELKELALKNAEENDHDQYKAVWKQVAKNCMKLEETEPETGCAYIA